MKLRLLPMRAEIELVPRLRALLHKPWLRYSVLVLAGFLVHTPALQGQFLWDDNYLAQTNPLIKSPLLFFETFRHYLFLDSFSAHYRPVQNISFMFDYYFWNTDAAGFHLTNILLHIASGLLLYRLLVHLLGDLGHKCADAITPGGLSPMAWIIAALWIVHPVHSAAVDYVSGRADSLAFAFATSAWLLVIRAHNVQASWAKAAFFVLAGAAGFCALCSREIGCIWLLIFLVHSCAFSRLNGRARFVTGACCLGLLASYATLRHFAQGQPLPHAIGWSAPVRATLMLRSLGDYTRLMLFPGNLHMERTVFYPENLLDEESWRATASLEYLSILGATVAAVFAWGCSKRGAGQRTRLFGAIWFFAAYLPVSNLFQLNATVAEHWLYLPSAGFLIFVAGFALEAPLQTRRALTAATIAAILALGARSWARSTDWHDDVTFFQRTVTAGGLSSRTLVNLALAHSRRGNLLPAKKALRRVLDFAPAYPVARNNLGDILLREGKVTEAEGLFKAITDNAATTGKEYPRTWIAFLNLAQVRCNHGDTLGAIALLEEGRAQYPDVWELISRQSELLRQTQGPLPALALLEKFAHQNPWHYAAALASGKLYAELNDAPRALEALHRAALLDVHDTESLNLLARIYAGQGQLDRARSAQARAVARQPDQPRQYLMLAMLLEKMNRGGEANVILAKVSRLRQSAQASQGALAN